jgi:hypothetical protein
MSDRVFRPVASDIHFELSELITEIGWRVDHGKADTVHELFTSDGEMILGSTHLKGSEEIRAWGAHRLEAPPRTRHVCTNLRFVATGGDTAEGTVYLTVYQDLENGTAITVPLAVGEYHDQYLRTSDGWRVLSRSTEMSFVRAASSTTSGKS